MHRWLHHDADEGENCLGCYRCGIAVDFPDGYEEVALGMVPQCHDPIDAPAHHFVLVGHPAGEEFFFLECAYGDAAGDEFDLGPGPYKPECIAA